MTSRTAVTAATHAVGASHLRRLGGTAANLPGGGEDRPGPGPNPPRLDWMKALYEHRVHVPLPPPSPWILRRGRRADARRAYAPQRRRTGQGPPRLPVHRLARDRQDVDGEDPRPLAELRTGRADGDAVRRMRVLRDDRRGDLDGRDRDGRRLEPLGRRRPRPPRAGRLRALRRSLEGLHPRRGAHAHQRVMERSHADARGPAAPPLLLPRDDRGAQSDPDDRRPLPALQLPAAEPRADLR